MTDCSPPNPVHIPCNHANLWFCSSYHRKFTFFLVGICNWICTVLTFMKQFHTLLTTHSLLLPTLSETERTLQTSGRKYTSYCLFSKIVLYTCRKNLQLGKNVLVSITYLLKVRMASNQNKSSYKTKYTYSSSRPFSYSANM